MDMDSSIENNIDSSIDSSMHSGVVNTLDSSVDSSLDIFDRILDSRFDVGNDSGSTDDSSTDDNISTDDNDSQESRNVLVDDINTDRRDMEDSYFMGDSDNSSTDSYESEEHRSLATQFMQAVDRDESPETISALVKDEPEFLLERCDESDDWDFLLTYPIGFNYGRIKPLFTAFLRDNPELPSLRSSVGNTAMHVLAMWCRKDRSIDMLKLLSTPGAAQVQNEVGRTPLHLSCIVWQEPSPKAIQFLVDLFPGSVRLADNQGMLPLHHICGNHHMKDAFPIELLIRHHPESLSVRDKRGNLPLHYACKQMVSSSRIISMLLELHPESVYAKGQGGWTVLHCVCSRSGRANNEEGDRMDAKLLDLFPEALDMPDDAGRTPLMVLCSNMGLLTGDSVSGATLKRMIDMCPNAVRRSVEGGFTALHYLCENAGSSFLFSNELSIHLVLDAWPIALAIYGRDKRRGCLYMPGSPTFLPYGTLARSNHYKRRIQVAHHLERETEAVFVACAESVLHRGFRYKNVKEHFRGMIARFYNGINMTSSSSFVIARAIQERGLCSHTIWQAVFDNSDFQSLVKEDVAFQNLVCGLYKMNKKAVGGRDYDGNVPVLSQVMLLEEVIDNLDCIYVHLRENPSLFFKDHDSVPEAPMMFCE